MLMTMKATSSVVSKVSVRANAFFSSWTRLIVVNTGMKAADTEPITSNWNIMSGSWKETRKASRACWAATVSKKRLVRRRWRTIAARADRTLAAVIMVAAERMLVCCCSNHFRLGGTKLRRRSLASCGWTTAGFVGAWPAICRAGCGQDFAGRA